MDCLPLRNWWCPLFGVCIIFFRIGHRSSESGSGIPSYTEVRKRSREAEFSPTQSREAEFPPTQRNRSREAEFPPTQSGVAAISHAPFSTTLRCRASPSGLPTCQNTADW